MNTDVMRDVSLICIYLRRYSLYFNYFNLKVDNDQVILFSHGGYVKELKPIKADNLLECVHFIEHFISMYHWKISLSRLGSMYITKITNSDDAEISLLYGEGNCMISSYVNLLAQACNLMDDSL